MGTTPTYGLRYPDPSMPANVPADIQNLATDTENTVKGQVDPLTGRVSTLESQLAAFPVADPGDLKLSARAAPASGWLLCDGSAVSRTTYSALFAAIGTSYGAGDGATTFNLPDYRGRSPVGVGPHADVNGRGLNEGALPGNRRPRHKHTVNDPTHSHGGAFYRDQMGNTGKSTYDLAGGNDLMSAIPNAPTGVTVGPQTGAEPVDSAGYQTCNVFIKT
jgi:microcystin-dependent protein